MLFNISGCIHQLQGIVIIYASMRLQVCLISLAMSSLSFGALIETLSIIILLFYYRIIVLVFALLL